MGDLMVALVVAAGVAVPWSWPRRAARRRLEALGPGRPTGAVTAAHAVVAAVATDLRPLTQGPARWWWRAGLVVVVLALGPVPAAVAVGGAVLVGRHRRAAARREAARALTDELPDLIDLLRAGAAAGLTVSLVVAEVAAVADGPVARALAGARERAACGERLADALEAVRSLDPTVAPMVDALVAAERWGAPLVPALDRLAVDARQLRRRSAELAARRLPVRLLFPLVACILPSVGLLTVVPVAVAALEDLAP